ncbi:LysR family transcriptional regulator, partial [Burkholderia multivorans]
MIDPRLRTLRAVREVGTVTGAAAALHVTPSTVSQHLKQLSHLVGAELVEPVGR